MLSNVGSCVLRPDSDILNMMTSEGTHQKEKFQVYRLQEWTQTPFISGFNRVFKRKLCTHYLWFERGTSLKHFKCSTKFAISNKKRESVRVILFYVQDSTIA